MWCDDPLLSCLKAFGYSVVRFPGPSLAPLQLLARLGRDLERLGRVETVLLPGRNVPVPAVSADHPCPGLSGQSTAELDAGLGLSLLGTIVASLGGSPQAVEILANRARKVTFEFGEVTEDSVQLADLDQYLADSKVTPLARHVGWLLEADDLYVTTSVVKSRQFCVTAKDENGLGLELDLKSLRDLAGAEISVSVVGASSAQISFEGRFALAFGFRALRLFYDRGRYRAFKPLTPGDLALSRGSSAPEWYRSEGAFAPLRVSLLVRRSAPSVFGGEGSPTTS